MLLGGMKGAVGADGSNGGYGADAPSGGGYIVPGGALYPAGGGGWMEAG